MAAHQNYAIVQPVVEDTEGLVAMHGQSWLDAYPNDEHGVSNEFIKEAVDKRASEEGLMIRRGYIEESYKNPDYYLRIAKDKQGRVVGFVDGRKDEKSELTGLYIAKSEYGTGLAQQLCDGILKWFGNGEDIHLTVVTYNGRAQRFYEKIGFKIVAGSEHFHQGTVIPVVEMIRKGEKQ